MSRQVRLRVTAVLLGGLLVGAPLLTNGTATAGESCPPARPRSHPVQVTTHRPTPPTRAPTQAVPSRLTPELDIPPRTNLKRSIKIKARRGTHGSAPVLAGKPPSTGKVGGRRVSTPEYPSSADSPHVVPFLPGPGIAAEQVATAEPMSENGVFGLLAAVSIVMVLGVSAGVIRAIVSERASRTKIA